MIGGLLDRWAPLHAELRKSPPQNYEEVMAHDSSMSLCLCFWLMTLASSCVSLLLLQNHEEVMAHDSSMSLCFSVSGS